MQRLRWTIGNANAADRLQRERRQLARRRGGELKASLVSTTHSARAIAS
jgi:hypothetical protein